jgi:hypothetical protein
MVRSQREVRGPRKGRLDSFTPLFTTVTNGGCCFLQNSPILPVTGQCRPSSSLTSMMGPSTSMERTGTVVSPFLTSTVPEGVSSASFKSDASSSEYWGKRQIGEVAIADTRGARETNIRRGVPCHNPVLDPAVLRIAVYNGVDG